ncbi:hypothetical protein MRX96_025434 [Rhipicephalus microplus]
MASTTDEKDSSAEDLQATLGASSRSDEQEIAAYEDAGFATDNTELEEDNQQTERGRYVEDVDTQPLPLSMAEPHTCEDIDHKQESLRITGGGKRGRKKPSGERVLAGQQGMPGAPFRLSSGRRPLSGAHLLW